MIFFRQFTAHYSRRRFAWLFFSLLFTMVAAPMLSAAGLSTRFMESFLWGNVLAAVMITLLDFRTHAGFALLGLVLVVRGAYALLDYEPLLATSQGIGASICLLSICIMLRFVLSEGTVTTERIFAALDVYLLLGVMCGLLFCLFEEEWPGSFSFQGSMAPENKRNVLAHTIYFSFVTLGTLGYGDVIPVGGPARALAVAEAISGQMYLVVVVARLVSLYKGAGERSESHERKDPISPDKTSQT